MDWKSNRKRLQFSNLKLLSHKKSGKKRRNGTELFMSIFSSISQSFDLQHEWASQRAQRETWKGTILDSKTKKTGGNLCNIVWRQQSILLIIRKPPSHLFNFCVSVLDPHQRFFSPSNLSHRSWQGKHKQPYSKINTAILCVFTFHSATSICDSVAQTVVFHFTPWGRPCFLAHCTDERAR